MHKLHEVLKKLLKRRNLTVSELSRRTGIVQPVIHRMTTGETDNPKLSSLLPIANYFNVNISQLLGEEPLEEEDKQAYSKNVRAIPLLSWSALTHLDEAISNHKKEILVLGLSERAFSLLMPDSSMEPLFPRESLLVFDCGIEPKDRSFVLVKLQNIELPLFRQLLIDANQWYLKPLHPDLGTFTMRTFHNGQDSVIACLVESRSYHYANDKMLDGESNVVTL